MKPMQFMSTSISKVGTAMLTLALFGAMMIFTSCGGSSDEVTMTEGLITKVKETQKDLFKITDESTTPNVADSRIIATYLDGKTEEFTLEEAKLVDASDTTSRRGRIRSTVMGGVMGYYMGRAMSSPTRASSYANKAAQTKSSIAKSKVSSSAIKGGKSGFGKGRSGRSFGG